MKALPDEENKHVERGILGGLLTGAISVVLCLGAALVSLIVAIGQEDSDPLMYEALSTEIKRIEHHEGKEFKLIAVSPEMEKMLFIKTDKYLDLSMILSDQINIDHKDDLLLLAMDQDDVPKAPSGFQRVESYEFEPFVLLSYRKIEALGTTKLDLGTKLPNAKIEIHSKQYENQKRTCENWAFNRWYCGPDSWNWVGLEKVKIAEKEELCIWAHPFTDETLIITFPNILLGQSIEGSTALSDTASKANGGTPVILKVKVNKELKTTRTNANRKGWNRFVIKTPKLAGTSGEVKFEISTAHAGARHYCFRAKIINRKAKPKLAHPKEHKSNTEHKKEKTKKIKPQNTIKNLKTESTNPQPYKQEHHNSLDLKNKNREKTNSVQPKIN